MSSQVRIARPDDTDVVGHMLHDFNLEFESWTPGAQFLAGRFRELLESPEVVVLLAEADGDADSPVGFAFLTLRPTPYHDGPLAQLEELFVRPERRDGGLGTALLTEAVTLVTERGAREMHIGVDEIDTDTRRFYERHGFSNFEPGEDYRMLLYLREL